MCVQAWHDRALILFGMVSTTQDKHLNQHMEVQRKLIHIIPQCQLPVTHHRNLLNENKI